MCLPKYFFSLAFILIFSQVSFSQNLSIVTAEVIGDDSLLIDAGNAVLLSPTDSSLVQGVILLNGLFTIEDVPTATYLLRITALGYQPLTKEITVSTVTTDLGILALTLDQLQTVEVVGQRPIYEVQPDRIVLQLENSSLGNSGNALDILRNAPKVIFNSSGQINVVGKGNALIYLDGQLLASNQTLENIASSDVKLVEVIENPPAKYEAAGNAVINIVTKRMNLEGYKLTLLQEIGATNYLRGQLKANLDYKSRGWVSQIGYSYRPIEYRIDNDYARSYELRGDAVEIDNKYASIIDRTNHLFHLKTSYKLSPRQHIGIQYNGSISHSERDGLNQNLFDVNEARFFNMDTQVTGPFDQRNNTASLSYSLTLDTLGSSLSASAQYATYDLERIENIFQERYNSRSNSVTERRTYNTNDIRVRTFQLDYHKSLSPQWQLDAGVKNARINNNSLLNFQVIEEDRSFTTIPEFSTDYEYEENVSSIYLQSSLTVQKWNYYLGLRAEQTAIQTLTYQNDGEQKNERTYSNLFPSASVAYQLSEQTNLKLSYNYRIQRPSFQDLNPFTFYADSLVSFRGNPNLVPEYSHNFSLSAQYKTWNLSFNYNRTQDKINTIIEIKNPEEPAVFDFKRDNIKQTELAAITLSVPLEKGWWSSYNSLTGRWEDHQYIDLGRLISNQTYGFYLYTNQTVRLPRNITLEAIYQYTSPRVDGIYTDNPISSLSLAASRKFWNDQLLVRFSANDVFKQYKFTGVASVYNNEWTYRSQGDFRYIQLSLNWTFGLLKASRLGNRAISEEELNRINRQ
ncbi:MAG: outer membrane beta-barrel family protein [Bacteroidota bacterium]